MLNRFSRGLTPIGIDIGPTGIRAVQLRCAGTRPALAAAAEIERAEPGRPLGDAEAERLAEVLRRQGFSGNRCVIAAPQEQLLTGVLDLPPRRSGAPVDVIAAAEMARTHKCDPAGLEVGLWEIAPPAGQKFTGAPCMVVAARAADLERPVESLERAGLEVIAIDAPALALQRSVTPAAPRAGAFVSVGMGSSLVIAVRDGAVVLQRHLPEHGAAQLIRALASRLSVDEQTVGVLVAQRQTLQTPWADFEEAGATIRDFCESLRRELQLSLGYVSQKYPSSAADETVAFVGAGSEFPGVSAELSRVFGGSGVPVTLDRLADTSGHDLHAGGVGLMLAAGLALHGQRVAAEVTVP